jgi:hypothetical protein
LGTAIDLAQLGAFAVGVAALAVTFRGIRDQLWLQTFTEYTKRYSSIMEGLPFEARKPGGRFDPEDLDDDSTSAYLSVMRNYLNLCSEELYLFEKKRIDAETWLIWTDGMSQVTEFPGFEFAWRRLRDEYVPYEGFVTFMDALMEAHRLRRLNVRN